MCLSLLRIVVLAIVLALIPARTQASEASFGETPVLVVSVARSQTVDARPALAQRVTLSGVEPIEMLRSAPLRFSEERLFVRVFRRFVIECSWLC